MLRTVVRDSAARPVTLLFHPVGDDEPEKHVKIGLEEISWFSEGRIVHLFKDCDITLCTLEDVRKHLDAAKQAEGVAREEAIAKLKVLFFQDIDRLTTSGPYDPPPPTLIRISVDEEVPFVVLAEFVATIQSAIPDEVKFELSSDWVEAISK